ncbi:fatty acyl-AMP ligase, partial [Paenibacillus spiritus]
MRRMTMLFESLQIETLTDMFRLRARQQPEARACLYLLDSGLENGSYTYGELDRKIRSVAALVQEIASPGDRVLLLYPPGLDFIAAFFGCLYAGVVAVPAYPPKQNRHLLRLQAIVADADACAVLTTGDILGRVSRGLDEHPRLAGLAWRATDRGGLPQEDAFRPVPLTGDTLAFLQYTSGSTGQPKGVMVSHHNLLCNCDMIRSQWGLTEREVCVSWLPAFHDMGLIGMILTSLYLGAFIVLMAPVSFIQRPLIWLEAMSRYRGTFTAAPNFGYELCVKKITDEAAASLDLSSMRVAANGSEPVRASTLAAFAERFAPAGFPPEAAAPCYGLAEATLLAAGHSGVPELRSADRVALERHELQEPSDKASAAELVSCGPSSDRTRMAIVHPETREVCPDGTVGEIWLSGPSVALGYWRRPDVTAEVFQATLAGSGDGPFLRTGDLGFLDEGRLFVTGRIKDLILIRGRNLYPQDLELVSERSHPALLPGASAAFTVEIAGQERLVVVQEVARHTKDTGEAMASIRRAVFQEYDVSPYAVVLIRQSSLPKTSSGKIQRRAARAEFLEDQLTVVDQWREGEDLHNSAQTEAAAGMETAAALASERPGSEPGRNEAENGNGPAPAAIERWLTAEL